MSVEGFVRTSGALMGLARDAFGTGAGTAGAAGISPAPGAPAGTGAAATAFDQRSSAIGTTMAGLGEHDGAAGAQLDDAVSAAARGRARMDAVIGAAGDDVAALAALADTPQGRRALIDALGRRLRETKAALDDGAADATTRAAAASVIAAGYSGLGRFPAAAPVGPPVAMPALTAPSALSPTRWAAAAAPLSSLANVVCWIPVEQSQNRGSKQFATGDWQVSWLADSDLDQRTDAVIERALSQRGVRYSWGGGSPSGPSRGQDGDIGFDCSSLVQFAYSGAGVDLPRSTYDQVNLGHQVPRYAIRAGDLVFSNFDSRGPGHVQLAISPTQVVEAPHEGGHVQISAVPVGRVVVKRILS